MRPLERTCLALRLLSLAVLMPASAGAQDDTASLTDTTGGGAASDPLSATNSIDLKWTRLRGDTGSVTDNLWIKGGHSFTRTLKLSYEITYGRTDTAGTTTSGIDNISLKPIFFLGKGEVGSWNYGLATGFEIVLDRAEVVPGVGTVNGYGSGSDLISPLFGVSLNRDKTTLVPLVQHYVKFSGPDVNTTGARLIAIQQLGDNWWTKADVILLYDWNSGSVPGTAEVELGKMITPTFGVYGSGIAGLFDSALEWGASINLRFMY